MSVKIKRSVYADRFGPITGGAQLVALSGKRVIYGFRGDAQGKL